MTDVLRPLSTSELLDTTFSLYRRHFLLWAGILAVPYLVAMPFQILAVASQSGSAVAPFDSGLFAVVATVAMWVTYVVASATSQGATLLAVSDVYLGRPFGVGGSLARIRPRIVRLSFIVLGIGVVVGGTAIGVPAIILAMGAGSQSMPLVALGLLLLVVLLPVGVFLGLRWSLAVPVSVLEDRGFLQALSRSSFLTKGSRGRILLVWALLIFMYWVVAFVLGLPVIAATVADALQGGTPAQLPGWVQILNVVTSFITQCAVGPLMTIAFALLYYDVRVRKEALDLQLMMTALDAGMNPSEPSAAPSL